MADEYISKSASLRVPTLSTIPVNSLPIFPSPAPASDDPVLVAIEMVRRAHDEWGKALDLFHEAEAVWMEEYEERAPGYIVMKDGFKLRTPEQIVAWHREQDPVRIYEFKKRIFEALDQQMPRASAIRAIRPRRRLRRRSAPTSYACDGRSSVWRMLWPSGSG